MISLLRSTLITAREEEHPVLEALLEIADSSMTYRNRYLTTLRLAPVLDLLMTDETNPRSLVFQLIALADHVEHLPRDQDDPLAEHRPANHAYRTDRLAAGRYRNLEGSRSRWNPPAPRSVDQPFGAAASQSVGQHYAQVSGPRRPAASDDRNSAEPVEFSLSLDGRGLG